MNDVNVWMIATLVFGVSFVVIMAVAVWQYQRLLCWKMAFGMLSNAERILLMWPHARGQSIRQLTVHVDSTPEGYARLSAGPTVLAKMPLAQINEHRQALQELIDSGKK